MEESIDWDAQELYEVEKILDMKVQDRKTYYLVKWKGWDINTATWQPQKSISHIKNLINSYKVSKKDQNRNKASKEIDMIEPGVNPYQQTKYQGHFLYGDQPASVKSVKVFENHQNKQIFLEIQWKPRNNGDCVENSFINSKKILEYCPQFLLNYYEDCVRLSIRNKQN